MAIQYPKRNGVDYKGSNETLMPPQVATYKGDKVTLQANKFTKTGHSFDGWKKENDTAVIKDGTQIVVSEPTIMNATWKILQYAINYNSNGGTGSVSNQTKNYGTNITLQSSSAITKTGNKPNGWNTKADGTGTHYDNGATYSANAAITLYTQWNINTYTITYNANGGTGTMSNQTKTYGKSLTLSANAFTRSNYTFQGWATSATGKRAYADKASYTANASAILYAIWKGKTVTLSFNANGGNWGTTTVTTTEYRTEYGEWTSVGNYSNSEVNSVINTWQARGYETKTQSTSNHAGHYLVYVRQVKSVPYKVSSVVSDTKPSITVEYGKTYKITSDKAPTKANHFIWSWSTDKTSTKANPKGINHFYKDTYTSNFTSNTTLYAIWEPSEYTITFDANGGTGTAPSSITKPYNTSVTLPAVPFTKTGHTVVGWGISPTSTSAITSHTIVGNITIYAIYKAYSYIVIFDGNGNTGGATHSQTKTYGINLTLNANGFTKTGYTFAGWATSTSGAVAYADKGTYTNNAATKLYAKWIANTYFIKFNANGATSGSMNDLSITYDTTKNLTANAFSLPGYTFAGWSTNSAGTGTIYANGASVKNLATSGIFNLYGTWKPINYTIAFNANGGSGSMSNIAMTFDVAKNLTANAFTKSGYVFQGWATSASGAVAFGNSQSVKNLTTTSGGTVTLYAVWKVEDPNFTSVNYKLTALNSKITAVGGAYGWHQNWTVYKALTSFQHITQTSTGWPTSKSIGWAGVVDNVDQAISQCVQATKETSSGSSKVNVTGGCGGVILDEITLKNKTTLITKVIIAPYIYTYANTTNKLWCWCDRGVTAGRFSIGTTIGSKGYAPNSTYNSYCDALGGGGSNVRAYGRGASMTLTMTVCNNGVDVNIPLTVNASIAVSGWKAISNSTNSQNLRVVFDFGSQIVGKINKNSYTKKITFRCGCDLMPIHGIVFYIN